MPSAVIYARFSSTKQREASIEDQVRVCREWCAANGYEVVKVYADHAISGRTDDRPQFQQMVTNAPESDIVLVYMMDRFSRDPYDAPIYKKRLRDKGVRVYSASENITEGTDAILLEKVYEGLAAVESEHISQRTKRGLHGNALKYLHNGVRVFGYDFAEDGRYTINSAQAAIVREVFERHNAGEANNAIARDLAARGVRTNGGKKPTYCFVYNMVHNPKYRGVYKFGDVEAEGEMPRIVDDATWYAAQDVRPKRDRAAEEWYEYHLAGKSMCAICTCNLQGMTAHGHGGVYHYYRCANRCVKPMRAEALEGAIVDALRELLSDRSTAREIARAVERVVSRTNSADNRAEVLKRLRRAQSVQENIMRSIEDGLEYAYVRDRLDEARAQEAAAQRELDMLDAQPKFDVEDFADFLQAGAMLDRKTLLDAFVGNVIVNEQEIIVVLNYHNKNREPARLIIEQVRGIDSWLPTGPTTRTAVMRELVVVRIARAA